MQAQTTVKKIISAAAIVVATVVLPASLLPTSAQAMPIDPGLPVKKIPFANQIDAWRALDKRRLIVSTSPTRNYLVTLRHNCHTLRLNSRLGISSSNNTVYAGFDYITADGERCAIQRINLISKAEKRALSEV